MNTIKDFLRDRGMTQAELAEKLGYEESYISMIISGKRTPKDAFRWRWVEAFGPAALKVLNGGDDGKT